MENRDLDEERKVLEFVVGDIVKCINMNCSAYGKEFIVNKIYEIKGVRYYQSCTDVSFWEFEENDLELVRKVSDKMSDYMKSESSIITKNKYERRIKGLGENPETIIDVYCILVAFNVICPARQHAIKKLLCAGLRNKGSERQDLEEAVVCVQRALELLD